ncbi:hypothetical protein Fmac_030852 [Flemingia macrophylla]|uniref:Disease resistance R13L4/SHOC-2-like LRR domain-containing protein n=1 Tax=Flemingia macrophylla TaxID=520843 RepID=A0ABD1L0F5_9FABA
MSSTDLSGHVDFHQFSKLTSLSFLDLTHNLFTGSINDFSSRSLRILDLSNSKLQGHFPNSIFELKNLLLLSLSSNNLSGLVNFHQFSKLKYISGLYLSYNSFLSINFDSGVDYNLPNLEVLYLSSCNINSFPKFLPRLQHLHTLDLSRSKIEGSIPQWFHEKLLHSWENIQFVDLSFNKLQGDLPIPPNGIEYFSVSNNELTGDIPSTMCNATSLTMLNLAHNNLRGLIPQCLGTFPSLSVLNLQKNNLRGSMTQNFSKRNAFETIKLNGKTSWRDHYQSL